MTPAWPGGETSRCGNVATSAMKCSRVLSSVSFALWLAGACGSGEPPKAATPADAAAPDAAATDTAAYDGATDAPPLPADVAAPDAPVPVADAPVPVTDVPAAAELGTDAALTFETCLAALPPPPVGRFTTAYRELQEKAGDGGLRVRLALQVPPDLGGTPGTEPFTLVGFALEDATTNVCVLDAAALSYQLTHHNFADVARATAGDRRYEVSLNLDYGPPLRRTESLSVFDGGIKTRGPLPLREVSCQPSDGGPRCVLR
jgi:hypothetical protein